VGAKLRRIRRRIRSVRSTMKITRAMELIAASRILRAEQRLRAARPYAELITEVMRDLAAGAERIEHPLMERRPERKVGLVVLASDRGLAGPYTSNVLRLTEQVVRGYEAEGKGVQIYAVGRKGVSSLRYRGYPVVRHLVGCSDNPHPVHAQEVAGWLSEDFVLGEIDSAEIVYTEFVSAVSQRVGIMRVLPVEPAELAGGEPYPPVFIFEPSPEEILAHLIQPYVAMKVFHAMLEAAASEHASRRRAMKAATENAEEMVRRLTREANVARQTEITLEIMDIVGGAEALRQAGLV
jgi:F-type H+-transporting ATPase subunit gamma